MNLDWLDDRPPFDRRELSGQAQQGLGAARALQHLRGHEVAFGLRDLADSYGCHPRTIRRWIAKAELEITRPLRSCNECGRPLPRGSRTSRLYCDEHASVGARVRRHRTQAH